MGSFSWMFADTDNDKALEIGRRAYVACPDGTVIYQRNYEGDGMFGGFDIYDLVVDWNKDYISENNIRKPSGGRGGEIKCSQHEIEQYKESCERIRDFISGKPDEYMKEKYGERYKRRIGIDIACYNEDNAALKYPIKICKKRHVEYDLLPASKVDPNQGFGGISEGERIEIRCRKAIKEAERSFKEMLRHCSTP